jgi:hypothetical protein
VTLQAKANALANLGGSANLLAALGSYDRAIEIMTAALGADHPSTAGTLHEKANALVRMSGSTNLAAAIALYASRSRRPRWEQNTPPQLCFKTRRTRLWL